MSIQRNLTSESVDQAGPVEPICVEPSSSIREVLELLKQRQAPSVLICHAGELRGIFTERDALKVLARRGDLNAAIETVMVKNPAVLRRNATVAEAVERMSGGGYRRLPIVDDRGSPVGMIQVSGIIHYLAEHFPRTVYNQPPVAHPVMQQREGP